jgi:hypothetical protein
MKEEIEMAYMAGILDGDGSFSILKKDSSYHPCIQLSNAFKGMSDFLFEKFEGSRRIKKPQQPHYKVLYVWSVRGLRSAKNVLDNIIPYLVLKKERAKFMLDFITRSLVKKLDLIEGERANLKMKNHNRDCLLSEGKLCEHTLICSEDPVFWSYFAGLMDTEGSFSIKREKAHSGSINLRYNPIIQMTMVPVDCINYIRKNCSFGSFCIPKASCTTKGFAYKMSIISKDDCVKFIHKILPYLRFKRGQALVMLNFCENYGSVRYCQGGIPEETLEFREEMYQQMRKLNA